MPMRRPLMIDVGQLGMGLEANRRLHVGPREVAQLRIEVRQAQPRRGQCRVDLEGLAEAGLRPLRLLPLHVHLAHPVVAFRVVRLDIQGVPVSRERILIKVLIEEQRGGNSRGTGRSSAPAPAHRGRISRPRRGGRDPA